MKTPTTGLVSKFALLVLCSAAWCGSAARADVSLELTTYNDIPVRQASEAGPISLSRTRQLTRTKVQITAIADYGRVSFRSRSEHIGEELGPDSADGRAAVQFLDRITVNAPGRAGQAGVMTVAVESFGSVTATSARNDGTNFPVAQARANLSVLKNRSAVATYSEYAGTDGFITDTPKFLNTVVTQQVSFTFGTPFEIGVVIGGSTNAYDRFPAAAVSDVNSNWGGITAVKDANGADVTGYTVTSVSGKDFTKPFGPPPKQVWSAGEDLVLNERTDAATDSESTNAKVPQWTYGYRETAAGAAFTPFAASQHQEGVGHPDVDGWIPGVGILVNTAYLPRSLDLGGSSKEVLPGQVIMQPTATEFAVARWTAPEAGTYNIAARWVDVQVASGDGATGHVVVNGQEIFGAQTTPGSNTFGGVYWEDGGRSAMPPRSLRLEAGDTVDFVVGARGDAAADLTAMNSVIRRAPRATISTPAAVAAGQDVVVSVDSPDPLGVVLLRKDGSTEASDTTAPYEFVLKGLTPGVYHLQAEAIDREFVRGASNVVIVTVTDAPVVSANGRSVRAATSGSTFEAVGGIWSDPLTWRRKSDGAVGVGVPGVNDVAIIPASVQVTLTGAVTVKKVFCEGLFGGDAEGTGRELTVTGQFGVAGFIRNMTVIIPEGGLLTNVRASAFFEEVNVVNRGRMVVSQSLFASGSEVTSTGTLALLTPPANSGPVLLQADLLALSGLTSGAPGVGFVANTLVGQDGGSLVGQDGGSLVGQDGGSLIGNNGSMLVGQDGGSLVGQDGGSLVGQDGGSLIGNNGSMLVGQDGGSLVGNDGAGLGATNSAALVGRGAAAATEAAAADGTADIEAAEATGAAGTIALRGGSLSGNANLIGNVINDGAFISPGASAGVIAVTGNYTQTTAGALLLEIVGRQPSQYDQFSITGQANLGGQLVVNAIQGYTPSSSDTFAPISYGAVSGSFDRVSSNAQVSFGADGMSMQVSGPNPPAPKALNISTRMRVEAGDNALIAGFIITGGAPKKVLVRGIGPSLPVSGALADPVLSLDNGAVANDDWKSTQEQEIRDTTIPPASDLESAIVATLNPGPHTAILRGKNNGTGVGLVEVYDLESGTPVQLANISTRGQVQAGDNVMIGGFIIGGDYPAKVLLRAIGPSLSVPGKLEDPTLELVDANGARIINDNWRATQEAEIIATTVPPTADKEAAIVATLVPGFYTAIIRGKGDTVGVALVEGYNLQ